MIQSNEPKFRSFRSFSSIIRPWLRYSIKVLVKTNHRGWNSMGLCRLITQFLWPPSSSMIRPWLLFSIKEIVKMNQTSSNSMGLRRLIIEFLWPPSSCIIRSAVYHNNIALSSDSYMYAKFQLNRKPGSGSNFTC